MLIADGKNVGGADLVIEARAKIDARVGVGNRLAERRDCKGGGIDDLRADHVQVVDVALLVVEEHRGFLAERTADVAAELRGLITGRFLARR